MRWTGLALALLGCMPAPASTQVAHGPPVRAHVALDHWSEDWIRSLAALGQADAGTALSLGFRSQGEVAAVLAESAAGNGTGPFGEMSLRLNEELAIPDNPHAPSVSARARAGWRGNAGVLLGGSSERIPGGAWVYPGPIPAGSGNAESLAVAFDLSWGRFYGTLEVEHEGKQLRTGGTHLGVRLGAMDLWLGRQRMGFGPGRSGGIVLSGQVPLDGAGLRTARPLDLPGFLSALGRLRGSLVLSRMDRSGTVLNPWFTAARVSLSPRQWLSIGFNRAALFGGDGNVEGISAANVALMTLGVTSYLGKDSGFENQVASIDVWARTMLGGVPVAGYVEFGIDDVGVRIWATPAVIAGVELPALPGLGALRLGVEHSRFTRSCCGKPPWYRHGQLGEGWTDRGEPLGHSLGGHGTDWSLHVGHGAVGPVTHMSGRVFTRFRDAENMFAPDWLGRSAGAAFDMTVRAAGPIRLRSRAMWERGATGWQNWTVQVGAGLSWTAATWPPATPPGSGS